jgi:PKD domain
MFKKLISNLPFNPSLLGTVAFYTKRLKQEQSIRRLGFGFMALAMFIQMFAVIAPPQKSLAFSNDYIVNGLNTRDDILRAWDGQTADTNVAEIYSKFGLTREDIAALPATPNVTIASNQADYWTIGRQSLSAVSKAAKIKDVYKNSEIPVNTGSTTVYIRALKAWDIVNPVNYYHAFQGSKNGQAFWILQDCGNFTTVGIPPVVPPPTTPPPTTPPPTTPPPTTPPPAPLPNPEIELRKTIDGGPRPLKPGDQFSFRFEYRNKIANSMPAINASLTDTLDLTHFDIVSSVPDASSYSLNGNVLTMPIGTVQYTDTFQTALVLTVRLKTPLDNGLNVCNAATLNTTNGGFSTSGGSSLCVTVINPCTLDTGIPSATDTRCAIPVLVCTATQSALNRTTKESTLTTTVASSNPTLTHVVSYAYDFGDKSSKTNNNNTLIDTIKHTYKDGKYTATATVTYLIGTDTKTTHSIACAADVETQPDQPLSPSKSALNITQKLDNAATMKTKANAGDIIEYTLSTRNSFNYDRAHYSISDYVGDIADYADVDVTYLASQGGNYDSASKTVSWTDQTVKANDMMVKKFRVTVKNPIPSTNQPGAMTTSFDCVISNKYGTEVSIPINCPPAKTAEYVATVLPNTGPGTSVFIGAVMMVVVGYFFARSRLLAKELELVRVEYATGGGF